MKLPIHTEPESIFWLSATTLLVLGTLTAGAVAAGRESLRGPHAWDFPDRNRETAFAYQYARDNRAANSGTGAAAIAGSLGGTVIINNSTTAVGNWQQIEMTLGDGAEGLIMTENHQDNSGASTAGSSVLDEAFEVADRSHAGSSGSRGDHGGSRNGHDGRGHNGGDRDSGGRNGHGRGDRDKSSKGGDRDHAGRDGSRAGGRDESGKGSHRSHESKSRHGRSDGRRGGETAGHEPSRSTSEHDGRLSHQQDYNPCGYNGSYCWGDSETTGWE